MIVNQENPAYKEALSDDMKFIQKLEHRSRDRPVDFPLNWMEVNTLYHSLVSKMLNVAKKGLNKTLPIALTIDENILWREMVLDTKEYQNFCHRNFSKNTMVHRIVRENCDNYIIFALDDSCYYNKKFFKKTLKSFEDLQTELVLYGRFNSLLKNQIKPISSLSFKELHRETMRFLKLLADNQVESFGLQAESIDQLWHILLSDTQYYSLLCHSLGLPLGQIVHHSPGTSSTIKNDRDGYSRLLHAYIRKYYELPDPNFWPYVKTSRSIRTENNRFNLNNLTRKSHALISKKLSKDKTVILIMSKLIWMTLKMN